MRTNINYVLVKEILNDSFDDMGHGLSVGSAPSCQLETRVIQAGSPFV